MSGLTTTVVYPQFDTGKRPLVTYYDCWKERVQEVIAAYTADLGGADAIGEAERSVVLRIATLTTEIEYMECGFSHKSNKDNNDLRVYGHLCTTLGRLLDLIGLKPRAPKSIVPTPYGYFGDEAAK